MRQVGEIREVRSRAPSERTPQGQGPGKVQTGAGQAGHARGDIASQPRGHDLQDQGHEHGLERRDRHHLDRHQKHREREVDERRAGAGAETQDAGQQDRADQHVGQHGQDQARHEHIKNANRREHELEEVAADEDCGDDRGKADDEHQDRQGGKGSGQNGDLGDGKEVPDAHAGGKRAAAHDVDDHDSDDGDQYQPSSSALEQPVAQSA